MTRKARSRAAFERSFAKRFGVSRKAARSARIRFEDHTRKTATAVSLRKHPRIAARFVTKTKQTKGGNRNVSRNSTRRKLGGVGGGMGGTSIGGGNVGGGGGSEFRETGIGGKSENEIPEEFREFEDVFYEGYEAEEEAEY